MKHDSEFTDQAQRDLAEIETIESHLREIQNRYCGLEPRLKSCNGIRSTILRLLKIQSQSQETT